MIFDTDEHADLIARKVAEHLNRTVADDVLDTEGAALLLKIHPVTVRDLAAKGELPACRLGKVWRFRRADLLDHITENAHQRGPESVAQAAD